MLEVMLIDDDVAIRDYMRDLIDWNGLNLHLACEAGDSETARELYSLYRPQIVITDINIPLISGLELAKEFVRADRNVRIIVITGYGNFDDVRDSVGLGAIDLLTKPIRAEEIEGALRKAIGHFNELRRQRYTEQTLSELLTENRSLLQERFVARLLEGPPEGEERKLRRQLELLSLDFPHRYFNTVQIQLVEPDAGKLDDILFFTAFKKLCDSAFVANGFRIFSCFAAQNRLDCLVNYPFLEGDERIEAMLAKLLEENEFYFQTGFFACIGSQVEQLSELYRSAERAKLAGRFREDGRSGITNYRNIGTLTGGPRLGSEQAIEQLLDYAQSARHHEFHRGLTELCAGAGREALQAFSLELLFRLSSLCYESGAYPWTRVNYPQTVSEIYGATEEEEIRQILQGACEQMIDTLYVQRSRSKNQLVQKAKQFIRENLGDPSLSLESVSSHIGLSKIYFCQLFHKEEGVSFNTYCNTERVGAAKTLLRTTEKKVFEISDEVGYKNPKYFNYVFKHITGVTPLEYRKGARP